MSHLALNKENTSKHIYSNGSNGTGNGNLTILFSHLLITGNRPLRPETISQTFHQLLSEIELTLTAGTAPPCLHCLRHSFAVQTLLRWYRSGIDPGQRLFHLSTFMGHSDLASTSWYLTVTDELFAEANQRFERLVGCVCQEVHR
ncbi:MAG: tyrosine-type recombinase/integrase [Pseudomonadota bacterium]|nr:tyrosine-type recombinase/integrase [Pseudomonadota bacterium]